MAGRLVSWDVVHRGLWLCGVRLCCAWPAAVLAVVADAGSAVILS